MYKVFINEKKLSINITNTNAEKNVIYEDLNTFDIAIDLLENTSCESINIYGEDADKIWDDFCDSFTNIEAAGGIVKNNDGEILFIHRLGKWDLPKGKIEPNETIERTAIREVEEETGLRNLALQKFVNTTHHIYREKKTNAVVLKTTFWYLMDYQGGEVLIPQIEEGITKAEWKNKNNILTEVVPNTFRNIELILQEAEII